MVLSILDLTVSLVDRGRLDIDPYAGNSLDIAFHEGHFYSGMAPGSSVLALPYYLVMRPVLPLFSTPERNQRLDEAFIRAGVAWRPSANRMGILMLALTVIVFGCSVLAGLMAVLFYRVLGLLYPDLEPRKRLVTTWLFSFATLFFYYSPCLEHRVLSTSLCFWAYAMFLMPGEPGSPVLRRRAFWCGAALGLAVAITYEVVFVAMAVGVFGLTRWRGRWPWSWTFASALGIGALLATYHTVCFGRPWVTPYASRYWELSAPEATRSVLAETVAAALARPFGRLADLLFSTRYGVLFYSPLLMLVFPALGHLRSRPALRSTAALGLVIFASLLGLHFFTGYTGTPGEFGFRFMLPAIPWLMLLVPLTYGWSYRLVVPVLTACSAIVLAKGVMYGATTSLNFWGEYREMLTRYGLSTYTFCNLKDHVLPSLSPLVISAVHLTILATVLAGLWFLVWRPAHRLPTTDSCSGTSNTDCAEESDPSLAKTRR